MLWEFVLLTSACDFYRWVLKLFIYCVVVSYPSCCIASCRLVVESDNTDLGQVKLSHSFVRLSVSLVCGGSSDWTSGHAQTSSRHNQITAQFEMGMGKSTTKAVDVCVWQMRNVSSFRVAQCVLHSWGLVRVQQKCCLYEKKCTTFK